MCLETERCNDSLKKSQTLDVFASIKEHGFKYSQESVNTTRKQSRVLMNTTIEKLKKFMMNK